MGQICTNEHIGTRQALISACTQVVKKDDCPRRARGVVKSLQMEAAVVPPVFLCMDRNSQLVAAAFPRMQEGHGPRSCAPGACSSSDATGPASRRLSRVVTPTRAVGSQAGEGLTLAACVDLSDRQRLCRPSPPEDLRRDLIGAWHPPKLCHPRGSVGHFRSAHGEHLRAVALEASPRVPNPLKPSAWSSLAFPPPVLMRGQEDPGPAPTATRRPPADEQRAPRRWP